MLGACSFATMRNPRGAPPECTDSRSAPIVDIAIAVASPFVAYAILSSNANTSSDPNLQGIDKFIRGIAAIGISLPVWAVTGTSSIYGFIKADRCERAKRDYQQLMQAPPGPGPYAPPPIAPGPPPP